VLSEEAWTSVECSKHGVEEEGAVTTLLK
jgi:hypothetical protein